MDSAYHIKTNIQLHLMVFQMTGISLTGQTSITLNGAEIVLPQNLNKVVTWL